MTTKNPEELEHEIDHAWDRLENIRRRGFLPDLKNPDSFFFHQGYKAGYAAGVARWVPVDDMLPTEDGLYCVIQEFQSTAYMSTKHFCDGQWDAANKVTHWLDNVPEVPK